MTYTKRNSETHTLTHSLEHSQHTQPNMARTKQIKRPATEVPKAEREALAKKRRIKVETAIREIEALSTDDALRIIVHTSPDNPLELARTLRRREYNYGDSDPTLTYDASKPITDDLVRKIVDINKENTDQWRPTPAELIFGLTFSYKLFFEYGEPGDVHECILRLKPVLETMQVDGTYTDAPEGDTMWAVLGEGEDLPEGASWDIVTLKKLTEDSWTGWIDEVAIDRRREIRALYTAA